MNNKLRTTYFQPAFLICVAVLATAGIGISIAIEHFQIYLAKEPLPLKKSLNLLDENTISTYKVVSKSKIQNEEIVKSLGTEDYIQWVLEDLDAVTNSSVRRCLLFITYYELPDRVPHVPEECYTGSGYQKFTSDAIVFDINKDSFKAKVPGRYLVFGSKKDNYLRRREKFPVLYLFKVNGLYANSRENARIILNKNLFRKSSYFCKVELAFNQGLISPTKEEAVTAGEKLLAAILPVLEREYWPDWEN